MMSSLQSAMEKSLYKDRLQALQTWHVELICLSNQHLHNVLEFLNFCEATETEFEQVREKQRLQYEQMFQLESLLVETIEKPRDTEQHDSGGSPRNVIERIRRAVEIKKEENQRLQLCRDTVKKYEIREEKLASLVKNLQNLSAELEQALEKRDSSAAINTGDEGLVLLSSDCNNRDTTENNTQSCTTEEDGASYDVKDIEYHIDNAAVHLGNHFAQRRESEDDGSSRNNYIQFKRTPSEYLNNFLRLLENHFLQLPICDDKQRLSHKIEHRSMSSQTERSLDTFESSSLLKRPSCDVPESPKPKMDDPVPERTLKPIILVEPFNQKCSFVGVTTPSPLPPPPVDPTPHSLEDRYQEIAKELKLQANYVGGFSPHHYYLDKMGEIMRFYSDEGYQLFEQFQFQKYVSVITARSAKLDAASSLPDVTLRIGFGGTKLEATEMAVQNICSDLMDHQVKTEKAIHSGDNVIHHGPALGNKLGCGDGPHVV